MSRFAIMMHDADTATTPQDAPLNELAEAQLRMILTTERVALAPAVPARHERKRSALVLAWIAVPALTVGVIAAVTFGQAPPPHADPATDPARPSGSPRPVGTNAPTVESETETPALDTPPNATFDASWAFDVTDVEEIRAHADVIVDADVVSVSDRAAFVFPGGPMPYREVRLRIHDVLKGSGLDAPFVTVLYPGGTVTLQQVLDAYPRESSVKRGLTALSEEELNRQTETYGYDPQTVLLPGERYVLALGANEGRAYAVGPAGFGVFHVDGDVLTNAITGSQYAYEDLQE